MTTYVSYSLPLGEETSTVGSSGGQGFYEDNITVGTSATGATGTIELRVDITTTAPTRIQVRDAVKAFLRRIEGSRFGPSDFGSV